MIMAESLQESARSKYISVVVNFNNLRFMTLVDENHLVADLIKEVQNTLAKLCSVKVKIKTLKNNVNAVLPNWYPVAPLLRNQDEIFAFTESAVEVLNQNVKKSDELLATATPTLLNATSPEGYAAIPDSGFTSPVAKPGSSEPPAEDMRSSGITEGKLERGDKGHRDNESQDEGNELMSEIFSLKDHCLSRSNVKRTRVEAAEKRGDLDNLLGEKQEKPKAKKTSKNAKTTKSILQDTFESKIDNDAGQLRLANDETKSNDGVQEKETQASVKEGSSDSSTDESSWKSYDSGTKAKDLQTSNKQENSPSQSNESTTELQRRDSFLKTRGKSSRALEGVQEASDDSSDDEQFDKTISKDGSRNTGGSLVEKKANSSEIYGRETKRNEIMKKKTGKQESAIGSTEASEIVSRNDKTRPRKKEDSSKSNTMAVAENVDVNEDGETLPGNETRTNVDSMHFNDEKVDSTENPKDNKNNTSEDELSLDRKAQSKKRKAKQSTTIDRGKRSKNKYTNEPKSKQRSLLGEKSINVDIQGRKTKLEAKVELETCEKVTRDHQKKKDMKSSKNTKKDYFEDGESSDSNSSDSDTDLDAELLKLSKKRGVFTEKQQNVASKVASNTSKTAENIEEKSPEKQKASKGDVKGKEDDLFSDSDSSWCSNAEDKKNTEAKGNEKDDEMNLKHHETRTHLLNNDDFHADSGASKRKGADKKTKTLAKSGSKSDSERLVKRNNAPQLESRDEVTSLGQMPFPEKNIKAARAKSLTLSKRSVSLNNIYLEKNKKEKATETQSENELESSRSTVSSIKAPFTQVPVKDNTKSVEPIDPNNILTLPCTPSKSASRKSAASLSATKVASWLLANPVEDEMETASHLSLKTKTRPKKNIADTIVGRIENNDSAIEESQLKKSKARSKESKENVKNVDSTGGRIDDDDSTARSQSQISKKSKTRSKKSKAKISNVDTMENRNENEAELSRSDVKKSKSRSKKSEGHVKKVNSIEDNIETDESSELSLSQFSKKSKIRSKKSKNNFNNVEKTEIVKDESVKVFESLKRKLDETMDHEYDHDKSVSQSQQTKSRSKMNEENVDAVEDTVEKDESDGANRSQISRKSKTRSKKSKEKSRNVNKNENKIENNESTKQSQSRKAKPQSRNSKENINNVDTTEDQIENENSVEVNQSQKRKLDATSEQEDKTNRTNKNKENKADIKKHEQPLHEENQEEKAFTKRPTVINKKKNTSLSLPKASKGLSALVDDESEYAESIRKGKKLKLTPPGINRHFNKSGFLTLSNSVKRRGIGSTSTKSRFKNVPSSQPSKTVEMNEKEKELLDSGALNLETLFNDETISW